MDQFDHAFQLAEDYCQWLREPSRTEREEARRLLALLLDLYRAAMELDLPDEADVDIDADRPKLDELRALSKAKALPFGYYGVTFDPHIVTPEESTVGDLYDDVEDIYGDLSEAISLRNAGHLVEAHWELCFSFRTHWGRHAASAIHALHCWFANNHEW